jgi:hypothetical protein
MAIAVPLGHVVNLAPGGSNRSDSVLERDFLPPGRCQSKFSVYPRWALSRLPRKGRSSGLRLGATSLTANSP